MPIAFAAILCGLASLTFWSFGSQLDWYDLQRVGQILLFAMAAAYWVVCKPPAPLLSAGVWRVLAIVGLLGLTSATLAKHPAWAFTEVALWAGNLCFALFVAAIVRARPVHAQHIFGHAVSWFAAMLLFRVLLVYVLGVLNREQLDPSLISLGFSHPRFFGQVCTLLIPLLGIFAILQGVSRRRRYAAWCLTVGLWAAVMASGTRGSAAALVLGIALVLPLGHVWRAWAGFQLRAAVIGALVYLLLFKGVAYLLDLPAADDETDMLRGGLTGRMQLWLDALGMALANPLLGAGPMHFADQVNRLGSHPHQAVLQVAAEWGIPAAALVLLLLSRGLVAAIRRTNVEADRSSITALRVSLIAALLCAGIQSLVDGVLVVPYTQLWLATVTGCLLGSMPREHAVPTYDRAWIKFQAVCFLFAAAWLVAVAIRDVPVLQERSDAFLEEHGDRLRPRFWLQGVIAE